MSVLVPNDDLNGKRGFGKQSSIRKTTPPTYIYFQDSQFKLLPHTTTHTIKHIIVSPPLNQALAFPTF